MHNIDTICALKSTSKNEISLIIRFKIKNIQVGTDVSAKANELRSIIQFNLYNTVSKIF